MRRIADLDGMQAFLDSGPRVIAEFCAPWCKPCQSLEPIMEQIEDDYRIPLGKVDVTLLPEVAELYHVLNLPTLILFEEGKPTKWLAGLRPPGIIIETFGLEKGGDHGRN